MIVIYKIFNKINGKFYIGSAVEDTPETIAKRIASNTGKTRTAETKAKMSAAKMGKIVSEETKRKQSEAAKVRWKSHRAIEQ